MKPIKIPRTSPLFRLVDYAMVPLMFLLGGFKRDSIQETHPWHCFRGFNPKAINKKLAIVNQGTDRNSFKRHFVFLFHAPIFGGWKDYVLLSPKTDERPFFIGWLAYDTNTGTMTDFAVNKLPITEGSVRLLSGPPTHSVYFFAVDREGQQIKLNRISRGKLGDQKYSGIRLL